VISVLDTEAGRRVAVAAGGTTVPLVEQNVGEALRAAVTAYVLIGDPLVQEAFLGIGAA
jgi:ABC-type branched-subunit amino acid transport system ATPase component